jgi:hypothetical protein
MWQKVTLGPTSKVLGASNYTISGAERRVVDVSEFCVDVDIFEFSGAAGGTIQMTDVNFDPTNPEQMTFITNLQSGIKFEFSATSGPRFWINSTSYYTIGTSGTLLMTSAGQVTADRNGSAKTSITMQVSGAFMYLV